MKKLFLIAALAVCSSAAFAQRTIDLVVDSIYSPDTIKSGEIFNVNFSVRNDGVDDLKAGDSIFFQCIIAGSLWFPSQNQVAIFPVSKTYSVGDTMVISFNLNPLNVNQSGYNTFCAFAYGNNRSATDSIKMENAGTITNNLLCRNTWFQSNTTGIGKGLVSAYKMASSVYPNPVANEGLISFELPSTANVNVRVMDISGKVVMTVADEKMSAGQQEVRFNASGLSNGVYFYEINYDGNVSRNKFVIAQ